MVISIEDALEKYSDFIDAINTLKISLNKNGFGIKEVDAFELGAKWNIEYQGAINSEFEWNIPYMLSFTPITRQNEERFFVDYVKNINDWKRILTDIEVSILNSK